LVILARVRPRLARCSQTAAAARHETPWSGRKTAAEAHGCPGPEGLRLAGPVAAHSRAGRESLPRRPHLAMQGHCRRSLWDHGPAAQPVRRSPGEKVAGPVGREMALMGMLWTLRC